jgi:hypothetical protein
VHLPEDGVFSSALKSLGSLVRALSRQTSHIEKVGMGSPLSRWIKVDINLRYAGALVGASGVSIWGCAAGEWLQQTSMPRW